MPKETMDEPQDMDADSSAAPAIDEADVTATEASTEAPAESSAATDETEASNLSVVRDVVAKDAEQQAEAAPSAEGEEGSEGTDEDKTGALDNENFSDVPFNQHPRFRTLLAERNTFKQDATRYQNVVSFLDQANLSAEEAANTMTIAGLAKTDPPKAWEMIQPWVHELAVAAGVILPDDLEQLVAANKMTREAAAEVSKSRAAVKAAEARTTYDKQRGERQQQTQLGLTLRTTAEDWVSSRRIKDPNFAAKEARLHERIVFLQRTEGVPNTVDGVKAQLRKAYDAINKELGVAKPRPAPAAPAAPARKPAIKPVTSGGSVAASGAQPAPASSLDVIRRVRARATA